MLEDAKVIINGQQVQVFINCDINISENSYTLTCLDKNKPIVTYNIIGDQAIKYESKMGLDVIFDDYKVYFQD